MSETIVVLTSAEATDAFAAEATDAGLSFTRVRGLPRFFIFPGVAPADFPLADHPAVETLGDGERPLHEEEQVVTVPEDNLGDGGWAAARIIRRKSPWRAPNNRLPAQSTFDCRRTGEGVDIFMIDSGCYVDHPEFGGRAQQPFLYSTSYATPLDDSGHGTSCLSVAGGSTVGIARQAQLFSYKFHNSGSGSGSSKFIIALGAIKDYYETHASVNRPAVVFCSWSGYASDINAAVSDAIDAGLPCCFPAGNGMDNLDSTELRPAESDPDAVICGGCNFRDRPYYTFNGSGTSFGTPVDVIAPAQWVQVARRPEDGDPYDARNGTSYATPFVVGVLACMLQGYSRLTSRAEVQALKAKLKANATSGELIRAPLPGAVVQDPDDPHNESYLLPDRLLYLDPRVPFEVIPGLTPRTA